MASPAKLPKLMPISPAKNPKLPLNCAIRGTLTRLQTRDAILRRSMAAWETWARESNAASLAELRNDVSVQRQTFNSSIILVEEDFEQLIARSATMQQSLKNKDILISELKKEKAELQHQLDRLRNFFTIESTTPETSPKVSLKESQAIDTSEQNLNLTFSEVFKEI